MATKNAIKRTSPSRSPTKEELDAIDGGRVACGLNPVQLRSADAEISAAEADQIRKDYRRRPAIMSKQLIVDLDAAVRADSFGVTRRVGFAVLSEPCKKIMKKIETNRESAVAFAQAEDGLTKYIDALKDLTEQMDEARRRLMIGLCLRTDMTEVIRDATFKQ